jgi:DNA-nicking Smr family endonuclease
VRGLRRRDRLPGRRAAHTLGAHAEPELPSSDPPVSTYHRRRLVELKHAYDEARFGAECTLNLRSMLPTAAEAARRTNAWLRERQASGAREVLVISGRGNGSEGGYSVVREAVARTLRQLKRQGVVDSVAEHTAGSFVARLAPMRRLLEGARRTTPVRSDGPGPAALNGLDAETATLLRALAERALDALGVRETDAFLDREMATQFAAFLRAVPPGDGRDERLRRAMRHALDDDDERTR